jgi:DNA-binding NtrC family response regulator
MKSFDANPRVMILDDEPEPYRKLLAETLREEGYTVFEASTIEEAETINNKEKIALILADYLLSDGKKGTALMELPEFHGIPIVMISQWANRTEVAEAMKLGAIDFLDKGEKLERILGVVDKAIQLSRLHHQPNERYPLIGSSLVMRRLKDHLQRWARSSANVLILGEPGTGKEAVANALHKLSSRASEQFISVNCPSISDDLRGSELFGHVKGAFTGADRDRKGAFELANGGTLYLAEIGEMSQKLQADLLHPLSEGEIRRIGSNEPHPVEVRVIAATNRDPNEVLRKDLVGRFDAILEIPPLRERKEDIPEIVSYWLDRICSEERQFREISDEAMDLMIRLEWSDNIREVINILRKLIVLGDSGTVIESEEVRSYIRGVVYQNQDPFDPELTYIEARQCFDRELFQRRLKISNENKTETARSLNIGRVTLYKKMKECGMEVQNN